MSLLEFIQLVIRNKRWVVYFPIIVGIGVFILTRSIPKEYTSDMIIYTGIASGATMDNDFEGKIDFHAVNSRFDNLINIIGSRELRKDVSIKLLTFMLHNPDKMDTMLMNTKSSLLDEVLDKDFVAKYKKKDPEATEANLHLELDSGKNRAEAYTLVFGEKKNPFNVKVLEDIKAEREGFSDMLKIEYSANDPLLTKKTLELTKELFLYKYQSMRVGEASSAVAYFKEQTDLSRNKLGICEEKLKAFRSANRVINYYEQTKYVADENEDIEKKMSDLQMQLDGYVNALQKVEDKIGKRFLIQLQSEKIVRTRDSLATEFTRTGMDAVKNGTQQGSNAQIEGLKNALKESIDRLYALNNTTEGIPGKKLVEQWLELTVDKQETESKLKILLENKTKFDKVFDQYAPMGSELNKLEREVETAEKEYLNLLHNLNQAILRERNLEVSETVEVIDDADMPVVPNPSKRIIMVIASVLACVILAIVMLIIRQYLDNSLASPMRMEKLIGITAATAFLTRVGKNIDEKAIDEMDQRALEHWQISLREVLGDEENKSALIVLPFNCDRGQVQRYVEKMTVYLQTLGVETAVISAKDYTESQNKQCFVIAEKSYPELQSKVVMENSKVIFFFFDAAQKLDEYQMQLLEKWKKTKLVARGILLNTSEQHITKYLGEIPRKRSKFRTFVKKQITRYGS